MLHGYVDNIEGRIAGWAYDDACPEKPINLQIFVGGKIFAEVLAEMDRPDLFILGTGFSKYGFSIAAPPNMRADEIVFGKSGDQFVIQAAGARKSHLISRVHHPDIVQNGNRETIFRGPSAASSPEIIERIIDATTCAAEKAAADYGPLWQMLSNSRHDEAQALISTRDAEGLKSYLAEVGRRSLSFGFFDGPVADEGARSDPAFRAAGATLICDRILSLAEALGCADIRNPEQGAGAADLLDPNGLLDRICDVLGIDDLTPPIGGYWGLATQYGILNVRAFDALHFASRIAAIKKTYHLDGVCEIGGGAGLAAYYAVKMGVESYKIVDLPMVGIVQAHTLRDQELKLYGERRFRSAVELVPPWSFSEAENASNDLLVNCDSLPEIETQAALGYLRDARKLGYKWFLSINHEFGHRVDGWSQNKVKDLAKAAGGYTLINRHRDWMRPGYVEELFAIE